MTDPFRDSETSAAARADELEKENEELAEQIAVERDRTVAEARSPEIQRLENEIDELEKKIEPQKAAPDLMRDSERAGFWSAILMPFVFFVVVILVAVLGLNK